MTARAKARAALKETASDGDHGATGWAKIQRPCTRDGDSPLTAGAAVSCAC